MSNLDYSAYGDDGNFKKGRFKVDASPDAEYVRINGHKMASASFRQGDEVEVGACRIFMINEADPIPSLAAAPPRDDATRERSDSSRINRAARSAVAARALVAASKVIHASAMITPFIGDKVVVGLRE